MMPLRIAINAQLVPGSGVGGTETALIGLVHSLARLEGPEEYVLVGPWENPDWLKPYTGKNQRIVRGPRSQALKRKFAPVRPIVRMIRRTSSWMTGSGQSWPRLAESNGFYEQLQCQVIHFPYQHFVISQIPAVFEPYDLQHVHFPQFFSEADLEWREFTYGAACREAHTVVVHSNWIRQDFIRHYKVDPGKFKVILLPPSVQAYAEPTADTLAEVARKYELKGEFAFYPAMTWEHKNHLRLLEAMALVRDRYNTRLALVCSGHQTDFFAQIQQKVGALHLDEQISFLGMIPAEHVRAVYRLSSFVVFPTLFEGAGLPLVEAWKEGSPVTCSAVTSLQELAGDGALLFDPLSIGSIAEAIQKMAADINFRMKLRIRGFARLKDFDWERTSKLYRAVYRRAANNKVSEEDEYILNASVKN